MKLASHLRRSRHGVFYFRITFPKALAGLLGQQEIQRSLFTRDPETAKLTGYQLFGSLFPLLKRLTRLMTIDPSSLDPATVKKLIIEGLSRAPDGTVSAARIQTNDDPEIAKKEMENFAAFLNELGNKNAAIAPISVIEAETKMLKKEIAKLSPSSPSKPSTLQDAFDSYLLSKKGIAETTRKSYTESLNLFALMIGGHQRMVHEITKSEVTDFNEALVHVPLHAKKRGIKVSTAVEMLITPPMLKDENGDLYEPETISARTCNDHLTNVMGFFSWAIKGERCFGPNPLEGTNRHSGGEIDAGAQAFSEEDLKKIFNSETYISSAKRPHQFWGPLMLLFTGARANEIACLDLADFVTERGIRCISIKHTPKKATDSIKHKDKNESSGSAKRVKNAQAIRC